MLTNWLKTNQRNAFANDEYGILDVRHETHGGSSEGSQIIVGARLRQPKATPMGVTRRSGLESLR